MSYYTATVLLDNNLLQGHIPSAMAYMGNLINVDLGDNNLSCNEANLNRSAGRVCEQGQLLPCFLRLSQITAPLPDASNMECPLVQRKGYGEAVQDCSGHGPTQLVSHQGT